MDCCCTEMGCNEKAIWRVLDYHLCQKHKDDLAQEFLDNGHIIEVDGETYYPSWLFGHSGI